MDKFTQSECINMQTSLKKYIKTENTFDINKLKTIAGVDIAYWKEGSIEKAVCCIVVLDINTLSIIERQHLLGEITFDYIPGCLAFREIPLIRETVKLLKTNVDIYMLDGNGMLHPRQMGLATHISFYLNKPTIGVAKTYYKVNNTEYIEPGNNIGDTTNIILNGQVVGRALRTHKNVKPVFVSIGNNIDIDTATKIALNTTDKNSHIPVPTRLADLDTHTWRTAYKGVK